MATDRPNTTVSHMIATIADGCCMDEPDERDHVANLAVQCCIDVIQRTSFPHARANVEAVVALLYTLKTDVDDCDFCNQSGIQSCGGDPS